MVIDNKIDFLLCISSLIFLYDFKKINWRFSVTIFFFMMSGRGSSPRLKKLYFLFFSLNDKNQVENKLLLDLNP